MWSKLALVGTAAAFVGPRPTRLAPLANNPLDKLGLEKPEDVAKLVQEKVGDLDLDSAKAFGSKNLDVLKDNQERALIDVAAAAFCGLLFAGVYGAVVFALGWFAAAPSTDAYSRPADSYGACIETALPGAAVGALVGMLPVSVVVGNVVFALATVPADFSGIIIPALILCLDRVAFTEGAAVVLKHGTALQQKPRRVDAAVLAGDEQRRLAVLPRPINVLAFI